MKALKFLSALLTIFAASFSFAASGAEAALAKEDIGTVRVGIDGSYPPYCFLNDKDEVDGFEVAIMKEIAKRNGLEIECVITAWTSMFGQLDSGRIDSVAEIITASQERREKYVFSKSYVVDSNRFLVQAGKEKSISTLNDLEGKRIGVASGQSAYNQLLAIQKEKGINFEIVPYETSTNAYDVSMGRIDASYMNPVAGMTMSRQGNMNLVVADCPAYVEDLCAYPFRRDERGQLLAGIFSDSLVEMQKDGTLKKLCEEWLGVDISRVE